MSEPTPGVDRPRRGAPGPAAFITLAARLAAGATFLYASLDKIADPAGFAQAIYNYRLLPDALLHPFALLLPWLEAVVGAALIAGLARRGAALLAAGMTVMFIAAVGTALARGLDISCGCFHTRGGDGVGTSLLLRDLALLAACVTPLRLAARDRFHLDGALGRRDRS